MRDATLMIARVQAVAPSAYSNQHKAPQTRYYNPKTVTKSKVKRDFKIMLDIELDKLRFDILI